jgi:hypothetical protein
MMSNCSIHPLAPLHPAVDPAYTDGPPPRPHPPSHAGEVAFDWPIARIPPPLEGFTTISIELLEDEIEREAMRQERVD